MDNKRLDPFSFPSVALTPGTVRFREEDIQAFVEARTKNGNAPAAPNPSPEKATPAVQPEKYRPTKKRLL